MVFRFVVLSLVVLGIGALFFRVSSGDILESHEVKYLKFNSSRISVDEIRELVGSPSFSAAFALEVSDSEFGDEWLTAIAKSPYSHNLAVLVFDNAAVSDRGVVALADAWLLRPSSMSLQNNRITAVGIRALLAHLDGGRLGALRLSSNPIGDEGTIALAVSPGVRALNVLELEDIKMTDVGFRALLTSEYFAGPLTLSVGNNELSVDTMILLADPKKLPTARSVSIGRQFRDSPVLDQVRRARPNLKIWDL